MAIYKGNDLDNLIELINESNPQLPWALDKENFIYGPPQEITGTGDKDHNTRIRVQAKMSSPYRGSVDLTYRRIRLSTLFRGIKVEIHRWWTGTSYMRDILPLINEKFGLNLHNDFGSGTSWSVSASGSARVLELNKNNYQYTGAVNIWMYMDKEELGLDVLKIQDIDRIQWPGGNDFSTDRRGQMQFLFTGGDFTEAYMEHNTTGSTTIQWNHSFFLDTFRSLQPDLELDARGYVANAINGNPIFGSSSYNNRQFNNENDIQALEDLMRGKTALDRDIPLNAHGYNRIGHFTPYPSSTYSMVIVHERDEETGLPSDYTPLVGEAVIKWNHLW